VTVSKIIHEELYPVLNEISDATGVKFFLSENRDTGHEGVWAVVGERRSFRLFSKAEINDMSYKHLLSERAWAAVDRARKAV